jgi:probable rRNA maturation factor
LNRQRKHPIKTAPLRSFIIQVADQLNAPSLPFSIVFVTDEVIRTYNRKFRGFDKATDVLSFCGEGDYLGDILISAETAYNQARRSATLTFESNIRRLLLHGLLHLIGYDHETDDGEMRAIERRFRRRFQC